VRYGKTSAKHLAATSFLSGHMPPRDMGNCLEHVATTGIEALAGCAL